MHFFILILSSLSGIAICTALRAIRRFRRQYCSRCSNLDKYNLLLYFLNFSSDFREILRGRGLFHVTATCKHLCYIFWKGYLPPFDPALKDIKFPFAACKKGLDTACKIQKPGKYKSIACGSRKPSCTLLKGRWLPLELLLKVIKYPLEQIACGIRELHATPIMIAIYRWEILI